MLQFNLTVLVFTIITLVKLRQSVESTMLDVFFPVLLLMPTIYLLRIPHIPPFSCYDAVLFPLGIATIACRSRNWRFQRADLWVVGFALAGFYTDYLNLDLNTAIYNFLEPGPLGGVLAYFIGKLLIEQTGNREQVAKRLTVLLAAVGFISISEFISKHDLFVAITHRFFGQVDYWGDQSRYGFGRVKGPFVGAEEAGIVFLLGFFLSLWLCFLSRSRQNQSETKSPGLRHPVLYSGGILLGLIMTLSRGPDLGIAIGYLIARVGMVKRKGVALAVALVLLGAGGVFAHRSAAKYSELANEEASGAIAMDEAGASATYRTRLFDVFEPIAEEGGMFGWSPTGYPRAAVKYPKAKSYLSIDNEYLLLWVTQGKVGVTLFILILAEGAIALVRALLRSKQAADTCFYYCLGGMLTGLAVVLITVFLAAQGFILFFLFCGWIQALPVDEWTPRPAPQLAFRRIVT